MNDFPRSLKIATVWLLVGVALFLVFQALENRQHRSQFSASGSTIEIRRAGDGHYHWRGTVNGVDVDFVIDTGATTTALPRAVAKQAGLRSEGSVVSSTAGGQVQGQVARADVVLEGGVQVRGLRVTMLQSLESPLLGMDVLSRLRWSQHGGVLRIEASP
jgi:aspartyl protease family protein